MARCSFAKWRPLPENSTQARITPTQVILHTAVDQPGPTNLWRFFREDTGAESHFWVKLNGDIEQFMDTNVKANCNRKADIRAISIETEDDGNPRQRPWTQEQVASIILLLRWVNETHGIPLEFCRSWDSPGIGWHSMWGFRDPIAQTGPIDNPWSLYRGKDCPGKPRIRQLREEIVPALNSPHQEDADMTPEERETLKQVAKDIALVRDAVAPENFRAAPGVPHNVAVAALQANATVIRVESAVASLAQAIAAMASGANPEAVAQAVAASVALAIGESLKTANAGGEVDVKAIESAVVEAVVKRLES